MERAGYLANSDGRLFIKLFGRAALNGEEGIGCKRNGRGREGCNRV